MFGSKVLSVLFLPLESYGAGVLCSHPNPYRGIPVKEKNGHQGMVGSVAHGEADENGNHGGNP